MFLDLPALALFFPVTDFSENLDCHMTRFSIFRILGDRLGHGFEIKGFQLNFFFFFFFFLDVHLVLFTSIGYLPVDFGGLYPGFQGGGLRLFRPWGTSRFEISRHVNKT